MIWQTIGNGGMNIFKEKHTAKKNIVFHLNEHNLNLLDQGLNVNANEKLLGTLSELESPKIARTRFYIKRSLKLDSIEFACIWKFKTPFFNNKIVELMVSIVVVKIIGKFVLVHGKEEIFICSVRDFNLKFMYANTKFYSLCTYKTNSMSFDREMQILVGKEKNEPLKMKPIRINWSVLHLFVNIFFYINAL